MRRFQAFEIMDLPRCPAWVREGEVDALRTLTSVVRVHRATAALLAEVLRAHGERRVVDLCSGGIGPLAWLWRDIEHHLGKSVRVTCTDRYPQPRALEALDAESRRRICYHLDPVDAGDVPAELGGVRTIFEGFHHFTPGLAERVVGDAVEKGAPLVIVEATERSRWGFLVASLAGLGAIMSAPLSRPRHRAALRTARDLIFPAVPLALSIDGAMSALRTWTPTEIRAIAAPRLAPGWRVRSCTWRPLGVPLSAVVVEPTPREPFGG